MQRTYRTYHHQEYDVVWSGTQDRQGACPALTASGPSSPSSGLNRDGVLSMGARQGLIGTLALIPFEGFYRSSLGGRV
jgi:hypothetical protein